MVEKISIYILGFNIDMLFNEGSNVVSFHQNINHNYTMSSSCNTTIYSTSVVNFLTQSHIIHRDEERELYHLTQKTIKLIEFFRIYFTLVKNKDNIPIDDEVYQLCGGSNIKQTKNKTNLTTNKELKMLQHKSSQDETDKQSNIEDDLGSSLNKTYSYLSSSSEGEESENEEDEEEKEKEEIQKNKKKIQTKQIQLKQKANNFFYNSHFTGNLLGINLKNKRENNREIPSEINFFTKKRNTNGLRLNNMKPVAKFKESLKGVHKNNELLYTVVPKHAGNKLKVKNDCETKRSSALSGKKKKVKVNILAKSTVMPIIITPVSNNDDSFKSKKNDFILKKLNHQTNILRFAPSIDK